MGRRMGEPEGSAAKFIRAAGTSSASAAAAFLATPRHVVCGTGACWTMGSALPRLSRWRCRRDDWITLPRRRHLRFPSSVAFRVCAVGLTWPRHGWAPRKILLIATSAAALGSAPPFGLAASCPSLDCRSAQIAVCRGRNAPAQFNGNAPIRLSAASVIATRDISRILDELRERPVQNAPERLRIGFDARLGVDEVLDLGVGDLRVAQRLFQDRGRHDGECLLRGLDVADRGRIDVDERDPVRRQAKRFQRRMNFGQSAERYPVLMPSGDAFASWLMP